MKHQATESIYGKTSKKRNPPNKRRERLDKTSSPASQTPQQSTSNGPFGKLLNATGSESAIAHHQYDKYHSELLSDEASKAWDSSAIASSSVAERRAADIIRALREYERKVIFGNNASEATSGPDTLDMGGQFLTNKTRI